MVGRAKALTWDSGHMCLAQEASGHVGSGLQTAPPEERRNVRVGIKRAFGHRAGNARNRSQSIDHMIAQRDVFATHLGDTFLRSLKRSHCSFLHNRSWV